LRNPVQITVVSLLSDSGVALEDISRLVGHASGSAVTEKIYRKQIRPILLAGAETMDDIFPGDGFRPSVTQLALSSHSARRAPHFPADETTADLEPPVGIEPTTCSLRVNRSAD
jgi:hypothetical protein